jgi:hypothetical protein
MRSLSSSSTATGVTTHPSPPPFEVTDVVRAYGATSRATHAVSHEQARVLCAIAQCRTAALGGHVEQCVNCGAERVCYDSCRNRHCPKCQGSARAQWLAAEQALLLPIPYFHVVFTLPPQLNPLIRVNPRRLYDLLFQTAAQTLQEFARDPKHLGAEIGITAVLHTWGQTLTEHIHVHCVVTGGGLSLDGTQGRTCQRRFLFAVKALGTVFRGKYLAGLERLRTQQRLTFAGESATLEEAAWNAVRQQLYAKPWVVYAKPPWGSPEQVLKYRSRYPHRVAIANSRLVFVGDGVVRFRYTDDAAGGTAKVMELRAEEFLRRFLRHVVPTGFVRIRHYGLLANRMRQAKLTRARQLLAMVAATPFLSPVSVLATNPTPSPTAATRCPLCAGTNWRIIARLLPQRGLPP